MSALPATLDELARLDVPALEELFVATPLGARPRGRYRGATLARLPTPGARRPLFRTFEYVGFELLPYGVDFDASRWFFFDPRLGTGRFVARAAPSRWRPTDAFVMDYERSRLPWLVRHQLYDEVKPLGDALLLGLGGVNLGKDDGDHFFFALSRVG